MITEVFYPPTQNGLQKTLDANLLTGVTASATLNNVTGIQNKKGLMVIDRVDGNNNLTPNKREYIAFTGTSGSTVVTLTRGLGGSTDQDHAVGAIVEFVNDVVQQEALLTELEAINTAISNLSIPVKATGAEINTGTDDAKFATAKAIKDANLPYTGKASSSDVTTGTEDIKYISPKGLADADLNTRLKSKLITATRNLTAASGDVSYTGVGFQPTSVIVLFGINNTNEAYGIGASDSAGGEMELVRDTSTTSNIVTNWLISTTTSTANYQVAVLKQFDTDGFTLTWTKTGSPTGTLSIIFLCFR